MLRKKLNAAIDKWKRLIKRDSERTKRNINRVSHKEERKETEQEQKNRKR